MNGSADGANVTNIANVGNIGSNEGDSSGVCRLVVLISGRGSNMEAIAKAIAAGELAATIVAVISNKPDAQGLEIARGMGIKTVVVDHRKFADRQAFDQALSSEIDACLPDLVVLAGFMRVLGAAFVRHYVGRLLNIHPSLLPSFPGLDTHQRALAAGVGIHGCSVHFVNEEVDQGQIVLQAAVPVFAQDDAATLAARVLVQEHRIFQLAIAWFATTLPKTLSNGSATASFQQLNQRLQNDNATAALISPLRPAMK